MKSLLTALILLLGSSSFAFQQIDCMDQSASSILHRSNAAKARDAIVIEKPTQGTFNIREGQILQHEDRVRTMATIRHGQVVTFTSTDFELKINFGDVLIKEKFSPCPDDDDEQIFCKNVPGHGRGLRESAVYGADLLIDGKHVPMECNFPPND